MPGNLLRRLSQRGGPSDTAVPAQQKQGPMVISAPLLGSSDGYFPPQPQPHPQSPQEQHTIPTTNGSGAGPTPRPGGFHRRPTNLSEKVAKKGGADEGDPSGHINLEGGLDIVINCEVSQKDPSGITVPYRLLVPALFYEGEGDLNMTHLKRGTWLSRLGSKSQKRTKLADRQGQGEWGGESSDSEGQLGRQDSEQHESPQSGPYGQGGGYSGVEAYKAKGRRKWF